MHARAVRGIAGRLGASKAAMADDLAATVGNTGTAQAALLLTNAIETAEPGQVIALVVLADGVDVLLFRTTDALGVVPPGALGRARRSPTAARSPTASSSRGAAASRSSRPAAPSPSASRRRCRAAARSGSTRSSARATTSTNELHLPPARISRVGDAVDDMVPAPMSEVEGTIALFTIDRIAFSLSPPITFAVVDFDGGGRHPVELTDVDVDTLAIGDRVEMTFRKLFTADDIHNYFWKARPVRTAG